MKKESFTSFMKQVAVDLQQSGNLGTAHVYRSSLNAILVFQESESVEFREITPEWLKHFEGSLRARGCSWNTVSTYLRTMRAVYNRAVDLHRAPYVPHLFRSVYTGTVSYTHLTLPTNREVYISVGAGTLKKKKQQNK